MRQESACVFVKRLVRPDAVACGVAARRVGVQWWGDAPPPTRSRKAVMMTDADRHNDVKADAF